MPKFTIIGGRPSPKHGTWWLVRANDGGLFEVAEATRQRLSSDYRFALRVLPTHY